MGAKYPALVRDGWALDWALGRPATNWRAPTRLKDFWRWLLAAGESEVRFSAPVAIRSSQAVLMTRGKTNLYIKAIVLWGTHGVAPKYSSGLSVAGCK